MVNTEGVLFRLLLCSHTGKVTVHVGLGNRDVLSSLMCTSAVAVSGLFPLGYTQSPLNSAPGSRCSFTRRQIWCAVGDQKLVILEVL